MARELIPYPMAEKHVGNWENNKLNGYAIKYFADGSIDQEGIFKDDEFLYAKRRLTNCPSSGYFHNCFGTYIWDDGAKYVGEWQNDRSMAKELILCSMETNT